MSFTLPKNRVVLVKPVVWAGWLEPTHSGAWLNDGAVMAITVPISRATGELVNPLTLEEKEYFEDTKLSGMDFVPGDLSPYKKPDDRNGIIPFWYKREVIIRKPDTVVTNDTILTKLNLSNPDQYLDYKILLANSGYGGIVAPNWESRYDSGSYRLVLVDEGYEEEITASTAQHNIEAYKLFDKIQHSQTKLYEFLSIYWIENQTSAKPSVDEKVPFMVAQVQSIIQKDAKKFIEVMNSDYDHKLNIHNGIRNGVIKIIGSTFVLMPDETPLGSSLKEVILYFKDERHQEDHLKLLAQIDATETKPKK